MLKRLLLIFIISFCSLFGPALHAFSGIVEGAVTDYDTDDFSVDFGFDF